MFTMSKSKKAFYEAATKNLLIQLDGIGLAGDEKTKAIHFTKLFRELFKYDEVRKYMFETPESNLWDLGYNSVGFCRIASVNFAIIMGVKNWRLMCINDSQWDGRASHHYLQHIPTGKFFDLTYDQFAFYGKEVPYELGHETVFNLSSDEMSKKFAKDVLNIDIIDTLKKESNGK